MKRRRSLAFTLVEIVIGIAIFMMVMILVWAFYHGGASAGKKTSEHSDALRSVVVAFESIRRDLARALYQEPTRDLGIFNMGRGVSVRIPSEADPNNLWQALHSPVTYTLQEVPGTDPNNKAHQLVRKDDRDNSERIIKGCYLRDLLVQYIPQGQISPLQAYLEVTMIGMAGPNSKAVYTSSMLIPMPLMLPTGQYSLSLNPPGR